MKNRILITGGCGFIGSHLTEHLVQRGYEVTVFDRYNRKLHLICTYNKVNLLLLLFGSSGMAEIEYG